MAPQRLSKLHKRILHWLAADQARTQGVFGSDHTALVKAMETDAGNLSHSLRTLEHREYVTLERTPGGKTTCLWLTPAGQKQAQKLTGTCE